MIPTLLMAMMCRWRSIRETEIPTPMFHLTCMAQALAVQIWNLYIIACAVCSQEQNAKREKEWCLPK
jgi:hypothetical protein